MSTESSTPICSWSRNRTGVRTGVINLKGLNSYIKKRTFKWATLKDVSQSIRKGSSGSAGRQKFSVASAPIRPHFCSSDLHDNHPANCGYVQGEGDSIDSLFEGFLSVGSEQETVDFSHQYSLRHFRPDLIPAKLDDFYVPSATQTEVCILVPAVGLKGIVSDASGEQDHKIFDD